MEDSEVITKIYFRETFGGLFEAGITVTEDKIQYEFFKQDILREREAELIRETFECEPSTWNELLSILNDNHVNNWKEQGYYLDQTYNQQATLFVEFPEVEFVEEGNFLM